MALTTTTTIVETHATPIRERREHLGLSRHALAARAGCSVTYLQNIEAGCLPRLSLVMPQIEATLDGLEASVQHP